MKKLKDTKFFEVLKKSAPNIIGIVQNFAPAPIRGGLEIVKNLINNDSTIPDSVKADLIKQANDFEIEMMELKIKEQEIYLVDIQNARSMQMAALNQDDLFSKRFVYFLSAFIIVSCTGFGFGLFFMTFPPQNQRLIEMFVDIYLFAGALTILKFYFGSTKASGDKTDQMNDVVNRIISKDK